MGATLGKPNLIQRFCDRYMIVAMYSSKDLQRRLIGGKRGFVLVKIELRFPEVHEHLSHRQRRSTMFDAFFKDSKLPELTLFYIVLFFAHKRSFLS